MDQIKSAQGAGGLADSCAGSQTANNSASQANSIYSTACYRSHYSCQSTCQTFANKYKSALNNTSTSRTLAQEAIRFLDSQSSTCGSLRYNSLQIASQGEQNAISSGISDACKQLAGTLPQSAVNQAMQAAMNPSIKEQGLKPNDPFGCAANPWSQACQACSKNPQAPACQALAAASQRQPSANGAKFGEVESAKSKGSDFNLSGLDNVRPDPPQFNANGGGGNSAKAIPNNSGGGIPGGTGASGGPTNANKAVTPGSPGFSTDIDQGLRSGGGYSNSQSNNEVYNTHGNARGFQVKRGIASTMDLKKYLPGGQLDPNRRPNSGYGRGHANGINGQHYDLFQHISLRYRAQCATIKDCS